MLNLNLDFALPDSFSDCKKMLKISQNLVREASECHIQNRRTELED
jgi:hypothetical protein